MTVADHAQGQAALEAEAYGRGVAATLEMIEEMCQVNVPDLAVVLSPDVHGMAQLLAALRRAKEQIKWAEEQLEDEITKVMKTKFEDVVGLGRIEMRTGTTRKGWDKDALVATMKQVIAGELPRLVATATGEVIPSREIVDEVLDQFLVVATPSWKTTGLRQFHIDPEDYCTTTYGRKTIQTPPTEVWGTDNTDGSE